MSDIKCLSCEKNSLFFIFTLGKMAPVNAFVEQGKALKKYPLDLYFCSSCKLVQLGHVVDPKILFSDYHHTSSASAGNIVHLKNVVQMLEKMLTLKNKKVLEIGSNDGLLLSFMKEAGANVLGVDPAQNLHSDAANKGVNSLVGFFNEKFAKKIANKYSKFNLIVALNVIAHTPTFISALKGIKSILSDEGFFMMENAYILDTVLNGQFDTIYHEHIFSFSLHALLFAYDLVGLKAIDAEIIPTQGTSIRVFVKHKQSKEKPSQRMINILQRESDSGFDSAESFRKASVKIEEFKVNLKNYLSDLGDKKLIGLGASARGVVILNYCEINSTIIDFIIDDTELKQEKFIPNLNIPIKKWSDLKVDQHHHFLLLSWNYADSFIDRLKSLGVKGKVLIPFPEIKEIEI